MDVIHSFNGHGFNGKLVSKHMYALPEVWYMEYPRTEWSFRGSPISMVNFPCHSHYQRLHPYIPFKIKWKTGKPPFFSWFSHISIGFYYGQPPLSHIFSLGKTHGFPRGLPEAPVSWTMMTAAPGNPPKVPERPPDGAMARNFPKMEFLVEFLVNV